MAKGGAYGFWIGALGLPLACPLRCEPLLGSSGLPFANELVSFAENRAFRAFGSRIASAPSFARDSWLSCERYANNHT